jgi:hypothetical protein
MTTTGRGTARDLMRLKGYLPAVEVAKRIGFTAQSVYDWMDAKDIHGVRLGKGRWVEWASVVAYFKRKDPETAKLLGFK